MGVSDWGNKGSVIKDEVDVAIPYGGGSDGGSVAGIEWGLDSWVSVAILVGGVSYLGRWI